MNCIDEPRAGLIADGESRLTALGNHSIVINMQLSPDECDLNCEWRIESNLYG